MASFIFFVTLALFWSQSLFLSFGDLDSNLRRVLLVINLVFLLCYAANTLLRKKGCPFLGKGIVLFLVLESIYAVVNIEMLTFYLPTIYLVLLFFFVGLELGEKGFSNKWIAVLGLALLSIYIPQYFLFNDSRVVGDANLHRYSNNFGYLFLLLVPTFLFLKNKIVQLLFMVISSGFCIMCFKRGAILILAGTLAIYLYSILKSEVKYKWLFVLSTLLPIGSATCFYLVENAEVLFYRFQTLSEGSGRAEMYLLILEGAVEAPLSFLVGHGFFSTYTLFYEKLGIALMAHSDYLQMLYDMGMLGCVMYGFLMIGGIKILKDIKIMIPEYYWVTFVLIFIWFSKALISGVMVDKPCAVIFLGLGYVSGLTYRKREQLAWDEKRRGCICRG